ncbi:MAG: flavohemoglobin expression-modulating QEGLA motif protein [Cyclobacteriaceae bacterium]
MQEEITTPDQLLEDYLKRDAPVHLLLHDDIYLQLEQQFPFLIVFHQPEGSSELATLIKGESSYLILPENLSLKEDWNNAISRMIESVSAKYAGFLIIEIEVEKAHENLIMIEYHQPEAKATADIMAKEFEKLRPLYVNLEIESRHNKEVDGILTSQDEDISSTWMKISLPHIFYHPEKEEEYHVLLREFRDHFSDILRQTLFNFIRVQTAFEVTHAHLLGRSTVDPAFWEADQQLFDIQKSFEFLLLVSAINTESAWEEFESHHFKKPPRLYYRLLPVDPEELKHQLYSIRIDDIHDAMLAFLIRDKRNELSKQLDMLQERGSEDFLYSSIRLYKTVDKELLQTARHLLKELDFRDGDADYVSARDFALQAEQEFEFFKEQDKNFHSKVHLGNNMPGLMVSKGQLYVPAKSRFRRSRVFPLIQHEVGTHVLTYYNGSVQPLKLMSLGLADYDELQEGLAVLSEYLSGGLEPLRIRLLAARVVVADMRIRNYTFVQSFACLVEEYGFTHETAFSTVVRIYQSGGFTKDQIYLRGLIQTWHYLREGGDLPTLFLGKIGFRHIDIIRSLKQRNVLMPASLIPRYWQQPESLARLQEFVDAKKFTDIFSTVH